MKGMADAMRRSHSQTILYDLAFPMNQREYVANTRSRNPTAREVLPCEEHRDACSHRTGAFASTLACTKLCHHRYCGLCSKFIHEAVVDLHADGT